jgi:hypothetical protein
MASLVEELQRDALAPQVSLVDLLRKALVVAKKLGVTDFESWLTNELNGYPESSDYKLYPDYRILHGEIQAPVPGGYVPVLFRGGQNAARLNEVYSRMPTARPIAELESLVEAHPGGLILSYTPEVRLQLMKGSGSPLPPGLHVPTHQLIGVLNAVRNIVLEWALRLENDGIVGTGMSFSTAEKATASTINYHVNNFYAPVTGSAIQSGSPGATQNFQSHGLDGPALVAALREMLAASHQFGLPQDKRAELEADARTIIAQVESPSPKRGILNEAARSLRTVLEGAAGNVLAFAALTKLVPLLAAFLPQ